MSISRIVGFGAAAALCLSGCAATAKAPIIDDCVLAPTNSCVQVDLHNQDLSGLDLSGINFTNADMRGANLSGANLAGANLFLANLSGAKVNGATFTGTNLIGTICPDGSTAKSRSTGSQPRCDDLDST